MGAATITLEFGRVNATVGRMTCLSETDPEIMRVVQDGSPRTPLTIAPPRTEVEMAAGRSEPCGRVLAAKGWRPF